MPGDFKKTNQVLMYFIYLFFFVGNISIGHIQPINTRGFIKGWQPGKLTGCQLYHAWLLLLLNQVVFLQESLNVNNLCPPVKTEYLSVQNLNETPAILQHSSKPDPTCTGDCVHAQYR